MAELGGAIRKLLDKLKKAGVDGSISRLEWIAATLLKRMSVEYRSDTSTLLRAVQSTQLTNDLDEILAGGKNAAELLEQAVSIEIQQAGANGQYPTDVALVEAIGKLLNVAPGDRVVDLACGSGRLLRLGAAAEAAVGIELQGAWARLAWANLRLRGVPRPKIVHANALQAETLSKAKAKAGGQPFTVAMVDPPFGEQVNKASQADQELAPRWSETAFTELALEMIDPGRGRAAMIVPDSVLILPDEAEKDLRLRLAGRGLRAVIGLPPNALQPYVALPSALVLVDKKGAEGATWFVALPEPPSGRRLIGTDAKRDPYRLVTALLDPSAKMRRSEGRDGAPSVDYRQLEEGPARPGYMLAPVPGEVGSHRILSVERFTAVSGEPHLLFTLGHADGAITGHVALRQGAEEPIGVPNRTKWLREVLQKPATARLPAGTPIAGPLGVDEALAFSANLELVGIRVPQSTLTVRAGDTLRARDWLPAQPSMAPVADPQQILDELYLAQQRLHARVERLFSTFDPTPVLQGNIPPAVVTEPRLVGLLAKLSQDQRAVYQQVAQAESVPKRELTPPFRVGSLDAASTLDLLTRMGAVVPVVVSDVQVYRLPTQWDTWTDWEQLDQEAEDEA